MKTILCYGDSNTWGYDPRNRRTLPSGRTVDRGARDPPGRRVLHDRRRTERTDHGPRRPIEEHKNGRDYLRSCLASRQPLVLVVMALGVNDLKARSSASEIAR